MTHPNIMAKKDRMCARFGHLKSKPFKTMLGALACYCKRCGECCTATVQPCATHEGR